MFLKFISMLPVLNWSTREELHIGFYGLGRRQIMSFIYYLHRKFDEVLKGRILLICITVSCDD
jgi:hypothetical protein